MGKIINGILGGVSGKVGGVVGSNWKGIPTIRAYAIPANPQSAGQTTQRTLFAGVLALMQMVLTTILQPYWDPFATGQSGYNAAMSANLLSMTTASDYPNAIMAQGSLELDELTSAQYTTATGLCTPEWTESGLGNGLSADTVVAVAVDSGNNIAFVDTSATRGDESVSFNIGAGRTVGDIKVYLFFTRGSGETLEVSNSSYFQATV